MPKLSYLISTYKAEKFIDDRLRNLLVEQTEKDIEVIIVDSCSPENEKEIVDKWQALFPDKVKYILQDERTPYGVSWLEAWSVAEGEFVCNANCDDSIYPEFTSKVYDAFSKAKDEIGFVYTGIHVIDEQGQNVTAGERPPFNRELNSYECHQGPCVAWRNDQEFLKNIDLDHLHRRANMLTSGFDYHLWLYFMSLGYNGLAIPDILVRYMQREGSIENKCKELNTYEALCSIAEYFPDCFKSKLSCYKEFIRFPTVPNREKWLWCKKNNYHWKDEYGYTKSKAN